MDDVIGWVKVLGVYVTLAVFFGGVAAIAIAVARGLLWLVGL
jgi:hypothetical protein